MRCIFRASKFTIYALYQGLNTPLNLTMCINLFGVIGASAITLLMFSFRRVHAARLTTRNTPPAR